MIKERKIDRNVLDFIEGIDYDKVSVTYGARVKDGSQWNLTKHSHLVMEVIYLTEAYACVEGIEERIHSSWCDVIIYPAGMLHQEYVDVNSEQKCMYIWVDVPSKIALNEVFTIKDINGKIRWLINELVDLAGEEDESKRLLAIGYTRGLFENIRVNMMSEKEKVDIVDQALRYMHHHYMEDLSVEKLAKVFYVNASHLSRMFKKKIDMTPVQCLINIRIESAKKLLTITDMSVSEVAACVGIMDNKYFSRAFKKNTQMTPTEFKKKSKKSTIEYLNSSNKKEKI